MPRGQPQNPSPLDRTTHVIAMPQHIVQFAVVVRDCDEALSFYVDKLGFELITFAPLIEHMSVTRSDDGEKEGAAPTDGAAP